MKRNGFNAEYTHGYWAGMQRRNQPHRPSPAYLAGYRRGQNERFAQIYARLKGTRPDAPDASDRRRQGDGHYNSGTHRSSRRPGTSFREVN